MEYREAKNILKTKLTNLGKLIAPSEEYGNCLEIDGVIIDLVDNNHFKHDRDYTVTTISLKTLEYDNNFCRKRKRILNFNVNSGNYGKLISKIEALSIENAKIKEQKERKARQSSQRFKNALEIFKDFKPTKKYGNMLEIKTDYFIIRLTPDTTDGFIVKEPMSYAVILELLNKLKEES